MFSSTSRIDRRRATSTTSRTAGAVGRRVFGPVRSRAVLALVSVAVMATALVTPVNPASAEPTGAAAAQQQSVAAPCGFYRYWIRSSWFAAYNHCGPTTIRIHADVSGGGSTNDFHLCVVPGPTLLGAGGNFLNAYYIGGAGCPARQRTAHTNH